MKTVWIVDGAYLFNYGRNRPFDYLKLKAEITRANACAALPGLAALIGAAT